MPDKIATLDDLRASRSIVAVGPSGLTYRIRPLNMERFALAGGLPATLRQLAMGGADAIDKVLTAPEGDEDTSEVRDYMDGLVRRIIVEPDLEGFDLDELPPVDYKWAARIALGEDDRDGQGRRLWGREPLSVWATFRDEHGCSEDCASCDRLRLSVADVQRGQRD